MSDTESITEATRAIVDEFSLFDDWVDKYEYIIDLGKTLPDMPEASRIDANLVPGCQSKVWFTAHREGGKIRFEADSEAMIVRGLIALLLRVYSGRTPQEILSTPPGFFEEIDLGSHLTGSRANGLHAMVKRIQADAEAGAAA